MICVAVVPPVVTNAMFDYFDIVAVAWLIFGLWWGRKRGMSQEVLPLFQWLGIVAAGGLLYKPFSPIVHQCTQFGPLWSNITAYLLIAIGVHLIYLWLKRLLAERLVKKDLFGHSEYYLGMIAGFLRFGCVLLAGMALMNSRVATAAELAESEKFQAAWFSDIRFPTYGEFQQDVLFKSCAGNFVESNLKPILIASVSSEPAPKSETIAQKSNKIIDDILSQNAKK
jgi:uncharacterized membrane protein required for colicin V production